MSNTTHLEKRISHFTQQQFPEFTREEGKLLIEFVKKYYEWLETVTEVGYAKRKFSEYQDVDTAPDKFFKFLRSEFMKDVPEALQVDQRTLLKYIQDFFAAKGSEKSFRFLFRILFDEEISFYNPSEDILRASDGQWVVEKFLKVRIERPTFLNFAGRTIVGQISKARARVERIERFIESGVEVFYVYYSNKINEFIDGECVLCTNDNIQSTIIEQGELPGRYISTRGHLSSDKYLQDNFFYQEYSYVINSTQPISVIKPAIDKLVHPSGTIFFNQFFTFSEISFINTFNITSDFSIFLGDLFIDLSALIEDMETLIRRLADSMNVDVSEIKRTNIELNFYGNQDLTGTISHTGDGNITGTNTNFELYPFVSGLIKVFDPSTDEELVTFQVTQIASNTSMQVSTVLFDDSFVNAKYRYEIGITVPAEGNIWAVVDTFEKMQDFTFEELNQISFQDAMNLDHIVGRGTEFTADLAFNSFFNVADAPSYDTITYAKRVETVLSDTVLQLRTSFTLSELDSVPVINAKYVTRISPRIEESDLT